jgi:hypothetical protein
MYFFLWWKSVVITLLTKLKGIGVSGRKLINFEEGSNLPNCMLLIIGRDEYTCL